MKLTKNGKPRATGRRRKATITQHRLYLRFLVWERVQWQLRKYLEQSPYGESSRMARALGVAKSQIHRFSCAQCNHDQEPSFTIGFAILLYLSQQRIQPVIEINCIVAKDL